MSDLFCTAQQSLWRKQVTVQLPTKEKGCEDVARQLPRKLPPSGGRRPDHDSQCIVLGARHDGVVLPCCLPDSHAMSGRQHAAR